VQGDTVDVFLAYADHALRIQFWGDEIERLETINPETGESLITFDDIVIYPANSVRCE
jgi:excinuclease ABC subunit B